MLDIFLGLIDTISVQADFMRDLSGNIIYISLAILFLSCLGNFVLSSQSLDETNRVAEYSGDSLSSANFTSSGGSGLAISGEPSYVGDTLIASVMVTNSGNDSGNASLHVSPSTSEEIFQGVNVQISPGSTREVSAPFSVNSSGSNHFDWWIFVDGVPGHFPLEGNISVVVMPSQTLNLSMDSIYWTNTEGLSIEISVYLSNGRSRDIILEASSGNQDSSQLLQRIELESDPGRRTIKLDLGHPHAEEIIIEAIPIGWQPSFYSENFSQESVQEPLVFESSITLEVIFNPEKPIPGSRALASISLENIGNYQTDSGNVRVLMSSDSTILAETEVQSVMPGSIITTDISLSNWPNSDRVDLEVQWSTSGVRVSKYYSVETNLGNEGLELPFDLLAAGYGTLAGVLTILVGTLVWRAVSTRTPSTSDSSLRETKESAEAILRKEKKEIQCTYCDQRLMVPSNHSGGVRCPACSMEFVVGGEETPSHLIVRSSEDTLNCPECEQALRVKMESRPVMSRCPVCKTHFMAEAEGD
jgi:ribosomal protein L37AE/L43A